MMKTNKEYSADELSYFRVCHVTTRVIPDGLRAVFEREWNNHYKSSHGQWLDTAQNGADFYSLESAKNRKKNARLLKIMKDGKRTKWDCTCLFYAIHSSDSIGPKLDATTKACVDDLREFRNGVFAHTTDGTLNEADFKVGIQKVIIAFSSLKLDIAAIKEIKNQKSFPIEEVTALKKQLQDEKDKTCALEEELTADIKPFSVLPPKPSHESIERLKEVEQIVDTMNRMREEKRDEITVIYLSGNPGSGKSQVARQIGENLFNGTSDQTTDLKFVMTFNAGNVNNLLQSYTEFAYRLGCTEYSISSILKSEEVKLEEKILHLKSLAGQKLHKYSWWLIIVDNVTDLKAICQYLPHAGDKAWGNGQVLVTTQDRSSISYDSHTFHVPLSVGMAPEEAIAVLSKISGVLGETDIVMKVAKALDFQPLALACAAVYVRRIREAGQCITWPDYLQKFAEGKRELTERIFKETSLTYPQTMTAAVTFALEREINDNIVMKHVFQYMSLLAPEPLSLDYILHYVTQLTPDEDEKYLSAQIATSSLILYSGAESNEVRVHRVVHYCLKRYIFEEDEDLDLDVLTAATLTFDEIKSFRKDNVQQRHYSQRQITHISCLVLQINCYWINNSAKMKNAWSKRREIINCLENVGIICCDQFSYCTAQTILEINLQLKKCLYRENHPDVAFTLDNLGSTANKQGQHEIAKKYYERALGIRETVLGPHHPDVASTLNNLGNTATHQGQYETAKKYYERALGITETVLGPHHPEVASTLHNLGNTANHQGQYETAKKYFERALRIKETVLGPDHPEVASTLNNLGNTAHHQGQYETAKKYYERALGITEIVLGPHHPDVASKLNNLGSNFVSQGQYETAKKYYERALRIRETVLGPDHPDVASSLNNLGNTANHQGQYETAKKYFERALGIKETVLGPHHPNVASTLNNLGSTANQQGEYETAKKYFERALAIREIVLGPDHPRVASTLNSLGCTAHNQGQYETAKKYYERALGIREKVLGPDHPRVAATLNSLGCTAHNQGQYETAKKCFETALGIRETVLGPVHSDVASTLHNLRIAKKY